MATAMITAPTTIASGMSNLLAQAATPSRLLLIVLFLLLLFLWCLFDGFDYDPFVFGDRIRTDMQFRQSSFGVLLPDDVSCIWTLTFKAEELNCDLFIHGFGETAENELHEVLHCNNYSSRLTDLVIDSCQFDYLALLLLVSHGSPYL